MSSEIKSWTYKVRKGYPQVTIYVSVPCDYTCELVEDTVPSQHNFEVRTPTGKIVATYSDVTEAARVNYNKESRLERFFTKHDWVE